MFHVCCVIERARLGSTVSYRQAVQAFGQHGAAELIYLVGLYCLVSITLNGFNVPVPESEAD